jgi:hypothetical protein
MDLKEATKFGSVVLTVGNTTATITTTGKSFAGAFQLAVSAN